MHLKFLRIFSKRAGGNGRNNKGQITVRHRGGGSKHFYHLIDFRKRIYGKVGLIFSIEKDSNRNCFIALIYFKSCGLFCYVLCPHNVSVGDLYVSFSSSNNVNSGYVLQGVSKVGFSFCLKEIPISVPIHLIEFNFKNGCKLIRSAGCFGVIVRKIELEKNNFLIGVRVPSSKIIYVSGNCMATIGRVSNIGYNLKKLYKAGQSRWLGLRPSVRGVAMNPVDHPHGGGEGKSSGGRISVSPWGVLTKGFKTTNFKRKKLRKVRLSRINSLS